MEYRKTDIRAGALILTSFVVAVVMLFSVSDLQGIFKKRKQYKVLFLSNDGLEKNASVRISGIRIGRVSDMRVVPELGNKVELTLDVYADAVIKEDVKVSIKTLGLVGKKYVDISGGSADAPSLQPGAVLYGEESLKLEDLTRMAMDVVGRLKGVAENMERVVKNVDRTVKSVDRTVGDPALAKNIKSAVQNVNEITENVKVMTANRDEVAQTLKDLPELLKKVDASAANLREITEKTDKLLGENRKNVDATMENVKEITINLKALTEDVKQHPWKLIRKP